MTCAHAQLLDDARHAALKLEEDKRQKAILDRLQAELDHENAVIQEVAQQLIRGKYVIDVIEDLTRRDIPDPVRIAQQATIYAKNVLLSNRAS